MAICFAWSNHVWWLLNAPLINYQCCLLPCTQYLQEGCKDICQSSLKAAGANEPWIHLPFNSISIKRTALFICLWPKAKEQYTAKVCALLWEGSQVNLEKQCKSVWLFQDSTSSLGNLMHYLKACHYIYIKESIYHYFNCGFQTPKFVLLLPGRLWSALWSQISFGGRNLLQF